MLPNAVGVSKLNHSLEMREKEKRTSDSELMSDLLT